MKYFKKPLFLFTLLSIVMLLSVHVTAMHRVHGASTSWISVSSDGWHASMNSSMSNQHTSWSTTNIDADAIVFRDGILIGSGTNYDSTGRNYIVANYYPSSIAGVYTVEGQGSYTLTNSVSYYDLSSTSQYWYPGLSIYSLEEGKISEPERALDKYFQVLESHIASTLNIPLTDYIRTDLQELAKNEKFYGLSKLYFDLPLKVGDQKPSIYLKNDEALFLRQTAEGINMAYLLAYDEEEDWSIMEVKDIQGQPMKFKKQYTEIDGKVSLASDTHVTKTPSISDEEVASLFNISLENYEKSNIYEIGEGEMDDNSLYSLVLINQYGTNIEIGDVRPSIYLNDYQEGLILLQKFDGGKEVYHLLHHETNGWYINFIESTP
ncbi:hypothetical protein [Alkaliphilus transvaalensis]|uniref:hypothetical protein n=1 Tax=Alkaliphilus transvaalensis TaxID=114628 RepID=UPI000479E3A8|nr:hypothetical protein [Alkaliphilus transvaalensis]